MKKMKQVLLLDCTLRDGGYINDWEWGFDKARSIINYLVRANVDIIEVGFLRNVDQYNKNITVCNTIEELNRLLPQEENGTIFSAMAMRSNYDISKLSPYSGKGIELIRITAHDYDIKEGLEFAGKVKDKGYKVSINPINIMGYSDGEILKILREVNSIAPYQFSIVDTFGSMKRCDLDRIVSLVDHNIDRNIRVGIHLHENMALSFSFAQDFINKHLRRPVTIDGSLMGMGRNPGNLPIELIADYLNDSTGATYDIDFMLDAIQDYIVPLKGETMWGYSPNYYLSARYNLHRNYAEYYIDKGNLTSKDINHILCRITRNHASVFDEDYANSLYLEYENNKVDDSKDRERLSNCLKGREVLVLAPGHSLKTHKAAIDKYINQNNPIVILLNFTTALYKWDYVFYGNNKRFNQNQNDRYKVIATSNVDGECEYRIDYNSVTGAFEKGNNTLIMLVMLLKDMEVKSVAVAGADGFTDSGNYFSSSFKEITDKGSQYNLIIAEAIKKLNMNINFITPSKYKLD